jgi:hypothetical protein
MLTRRILDFSTPEGAIKWRDENVVREFTAVKT